MRKRKLKLKTNKIDYKYKSNLASSIFLSIIYVVQLIILLFNLSRIPDIASLNSIMFFEIIVLGAIIFQFYITYSYFKEYKFGTDIRKAKLKFIGDFIKQISEIDNKIKTIKTKLHVLKSTHPLFEKSEVQMNNLQDSLSIITNKYEKIKFSEVKIFRANTQRELNKRIKYITQSVHNLYTQCENIELQLKQEFR
ncbi:MAG: hypothetical protein ACFE9S_16405 [Candidatus Hermodarchaeota archaeon]